MVNNYQQKSAKLMQWATRAPALHKQMVMEEAATRIIQRTPVDTGQARSNWNMAIGQADTSTRPTEGTSGAGAIARAKAVLRNFQLGEKAYFTNSLPYIRRLELGWSQQAPAGMVLLTLAEMGLIFQRTFKVAFTEAKRG